MLLQPARATSAKRRNPAHPAGLIAISGMVIRTSQLIPEMQEAFFQCQVCAHTARVEIDRGRIAEPCVCERCHTSHSMALIHNRSMFSDKQMVRAPSMCPVLFCPCWVLRSSV